MREICDQYDVLLVSDEVICAFGRIGSMFACDDFGYVPDIITCAKGMTSGYSPLGAMIACDRVFEPFATGTESFLHGYTFGGHPVSAAVGLANLDIFEREGINAHVREQSPAFRATLEKLLDLPIVGDVRGEGFFFGIELVKDKTTKETFDDEESERLLRGFLSKALWEAGLYCRTDDRGDPVIQLAPKPATCCSTTSTRRPGSPRSRWKAVQSPVKPAPTTATSTSVSPSSGGRGARSSPSATTWSIHRTPASPPLTAATRPRSAPRAGSAPSPRTRPVRRSAAARAG